jgi:hypothetical protein
MSLAWTPIILLLLLLPGLGTWVGYHLGPKPGRNSELPEFKIGDAPMLLIAMVVIASLLVHALLYAVNREGCNTSCIEMRLVLSALEVGKEEAADVQALANSIDKHWPMILTYFGSSVVLGFGLGLLLSLFPKPLPEWWAQDISGPNKIRYIEVELLTDDTCHCRVIYRGRLVSYRAASDGTVSEIVLHGAERKVLGPNGASEQRHRIDGTYTMLTGTRIISLSFVEAYEIRSLTLEE